MPETINPAKTTTKMKSPFELSIDHIRRSEPQQEEETPESVVFKVHEFKTVTDREGNQVEILSATNLVTLQELKNRRDELQGQISMVDSLIQQMTDTLVQTDNQLKVSSQ